MDAKIKQEEKLRLRRWGMVDALMDCLALLEQAGGSGAAAHNAALGKAVEFWLAEVGGTRRAGQQAELDAGRQEGYRACAEWLAQGLERDALAARLLQQVFAEWPRDREDYQRGYDAFLEKELENPRALYYSSSHVWVTAVDDLRTKVTCAGEQGQVLSHRVVRRAVKLLHMHPEHLAGYLAGHLAGDFTPAHPPACARQPQSAPAEAVTKRRHSLGAGLWRRLIRRR